MKKSYGTVNIAFVGPFASGKTYMSKLLVQELKRRNIKAHKLSIADEIKRLARDLFGMKKKNRRLLQVLGAKMRDIDKMVWINYAVNKIKRRNLEPFIIDDLRFLHEYSEIKRNFPNTITVKIRSSKDARDNIYKRLYGRKPTTTESNDSTETELNKIKCDYEIINDYKRESAERSINIMIDKFFTKTAKKR
ncbi:P-loop containing nucleoside triphosphate hydrolase [Candidatus Mancarchaeum acidiphilum]|uniref:P-loop containing nucleoside triphosphate hydrolase n=1 Tax=Candidatus Mancarchaeum acidiphilum TaxID=1920749 RepID=A0A218NNN4_9ARCH|nr:hypothetical protein [Candidatus Mancarchaeum acidiphilum]ASI14079.1 P-loop containing nucleoside triphosphate hydrolase [Candidatus Mancarchaeum acidiphilum]